MTNSLSKVFVIKTTDRAKGIPALLEKFNLNDFAGKTVALKANYNSADPYPASTHIDTLRAVVEALKDAGAMKVTMAERSGMGDTRKVLEQMGVFRLSEELGFETVVLDELGREGWIKFERDQTHWLRGFYLAKVFQDADKVVQTCCLKTHRFGGHFTLSLKNSVGLVAKKVPGGHYDYMWELHGSPFQRLMIAEINSRYAVDFVIMDGIKAFVTGGPESGKVVEPGLLLASQDRVAIDAVGVAILKLYGAKGKVGQEHVFEQDQLKRAAELGFGVRSADEIQLTSLDDNTQADVERIEQILRAPVAIH
ncbi:MAG: DUF362 domain-containing protein [Candidatus Bathyarchaeota archaeon]|nr:DUF362 domain-containing protein [Candidatus Bathyarchaeota archaeon]